MNGKLQLICEKKKTGENANKILWKLFVLKIHETKNFYQQIKIEASEFIFMYHKRF